MKRKGLVVFSAGSSYDLRPMTDREFWEALGKALATRRDELHYKTTKAFSRAMGGRPNEVTLNAIEAGNPGYASSITEYCQKLEVKLAEVVASVLPTATVSHEATQVALAFDAVKSATSRELVRLALKQGREQERPAAGDGPAEPVKKPGRSERAR